MSVINFLGDAWCVRMDEGDPHEDALRIADALGRLTRPRKPAKGIGNPKRILMGIALVHAHAPGIPKEVNDAHESILRVWA